MVDKELQEQGVEHQERPCLIPLPTFPDERGTLTVAEWGQALPFRPGRVFWLTDCLAARGGHKLTGPYLIVAVIGKFTVTAWRPQSSDDTHIEHLRIPSVGCYVPGGFVCYLNNWIHPAVALIVAEDKYEPRPDSVDSSVG